MGQFKKARLTIFRRPGKGSGFISKELALQQVFRQGRTVQRHKWFRAAPALPVDAVSEKFFAGSCLTHNQHIGIHPAVTLCHKDILPYGRAASNDIVKGILGRKSLFRKALPDFSFCLNNLLGVAGNNDGALSHLVHQYGPVFRVQFPVLPLDNLLPFPSGLHHMLPLKGRADLLHGTACVVSLGGKPKGAVRLVVQCLNQPAAVYSNQGIGAGVEDGAGHFGPGPLHIDGPGRIHGLL